MANDEHRRLLLTPGPLTTSRTVREAMLRDWGSRDDDFIALNRRVRGRLLEIAGGGEAHTCVPLQGSGTFAVEAMLTTLVPPQGRILILVNGAYGRRMVAICRRAGRAVIMHETPEDTIPDPADVARILRADAGIGHVAMVHCETTSGILNPLTAIAKVVAEAGRPLLVDAMSAFGALPLDLQETPMQAVAASANKCLQGVPGLAFVICDAGALRTAAGNAASLSLDLSDQWQAMDGNGQWRFTPPTHVIAALARALDEHAAEGGSPARLARYRRNCEVLVEGMRELGFAPYLDPALQAPIIVTFLLPQAPCFDFQRFYDGLNRRGYVIYPGKLTAVDSFRLGCIGDLDEGDMRGAIEAVRETLVEMQVRLSA